MLCRELAYLHSVVTWAFLPEQIRYFKSPDLKSISKSSPDDDYYDNNFLMNFITAYTSGLRNIFGKGKLWLLLYALNFLFAILLAYPLSGSLGNKLGDTLAADKLFEKFDYIRFSMI